VSNLATRSALAGFAVPARYGIAGATGIMVSERQGLALATMLARKGQEAALARRVQEMFGIALPAAPRRAAAGSIAFVWAGPGHWLAVAETEEGHRFEARLREGLAGLASVSDQSDGRVVIRISGVRARDVLAKGLPLDLHPRAFAPGHAASTVAGHVGVQLWQLDAAPTYELAMFRGFAVSLWQWLIESAAEFGVTVEA
jgi:methylglutamate dehydrogenase subunit D